MQFLIVAPFIRLRSEGFISRHISIAEEMALLGNEVIVVTSKFSHFAKKNRNFSRYFEKGVNYYFVPEVGYKNNRSFYRFLSHILLSINIIIFLFKIKFAKRYSFDAIISTMPLGLLSLFIGVYAKLFKFKLFIDVQDKWPDIFVHLTYNLPYPINKLLEKYIKNSSIILRRILCVLSYGVIGVSEEYLDWYFSNVPENFYIHHILSEKLYLGSQFKNFLKVNKKINFKNKTQINLLIFGSLVQSYNFKLAVEAIKSLNQKENNKEFRLTIIGSGPNFTELKKYISTYSYINLIPEIPFENLYSYIEETDFLINPLRKNASQSISNRLCDYLVSNKPVLTSSFPIELKEQKLNLFFYESDNVDSLINLILKLINSDYEIFSNFQKDTEKFYRKYSYPKFVKNFIFELNRLSKKVK